MKKQRTPKLNKKGFTLTELCIALAVLAICGTLVATFTGLISTNVQNISYNESINDAYEMIGKQLDHFISKYDTKDYIFTTEGVNHTFKAGDEEFHFNLYDSKFEYTTYEAQIVNGTVYFQVYYHDKFKNQDSSLLFVRSIRSINY